MQSMAYFAYIWNGIGIFSDKNIWLARARWIDDSYISAVDCNAQRTDYATIWLLNG